MSRKGTPIQPRYRYNRRATSESLNKITSGRPLRIRRMIPGSAESCSTTYEVSVHDFSGDFRRQSSSWQRPNAKFIRRGRPAAADHLKLNARLGGQGMQTIKALAKEAFDPPVHHADAGAEKANLQVHAVAPGFAAATACQKCVRESSGRPGTIQRGSPGGNPVSRRGSASGYKSPF